MAEEPGENKQAAPVQQANQPAQAKPAAQANQPAQAKQPAGQPQQKGVPVYIIAGAAVIILALAVFLLLQQGGERELPLSDFRALFNSTGKVAVFNDVSGIPPGAKTTLLNCGVQLSFILSYAGKNVSNYAIDGDLCYGGSASAAQERPVSECMREAEREGRMPFTVSYNSTQNKTLLTTGGAHYYGDESFLTQCTITGLIR